MFTRCVTFEGSSSISIMAADLSLSSGVRTKVLLEVNLINWFSFVMNYY